MRKSLWLDPGTIAEAPERLLLTVVLGLLACPVIAAPCRVVGVSDGDTMTVRCGERPQERVRIAEIDAPEKSQPFGKAAKAMASELVFGKDIDLRATGKDRYGRTIGKVILPDGIDFGREMIKSGLAWHYRAYSKDESLSKVEAEAKAERRGLWADSQVPTAPWEFRKAGRTKAGNKSRKPRPRTPAVP